MAGKLIVWAHTSPRTAVQGKSGLIIRIVCDKWANIVPFIRHCLLN